MGEDTPGGVHPEEKGAKADTHRAQSRQSREEMDTA